MTITVPRSSGPSVEQAPLPGARVSPDPMGAFDSGVLEVNKAAQQIFVEEKQKSDMTAFMDADLLAAKRGTEIEYKYKKDYVGKAAAGAAQDADVEYEKDMAAVSKNLSTDQRAMFDKSVKQRRIGLNATLEHHSYNEIAKYELEVIDQYVTESKNGAINAAGLYTPGDAAGAALADEAIVTSIQRQHAALVKFAVDHGKDDMWLKNKRAEATSGTHVAVIDVMLSKGNDLMAKDYADLHGKEIVGEKDVVHVNKSLKVGTMRGESQRQHDIIFANNDSWETRFKEADKIDNPDTRAATKQLLDDTFSREKRLETARGNDNFIGAATEAEGARDVRAIHPSIWASLTPAERTTIEQRVKHVKEGTEPYQDSVVWTSFMMMPAKDVAKLTMADVLRKYRPNLDDSHYDALLRQVNAAQEAATKGDTSYLSAMQTDRDTVNNAWLRYIGKTTLGDMNEKERTRWMAYSDGASVAVQKFEGSKGRKATDEEKQQVIKQKLAESVYIDETGPWDPKVPVMAVGAGEAENAYVPVDQIPANHRAGMVNLARSLGIIPPNATKAEAEVFLGDRMSKAYAAAALGRSDEAIKEILSTGAKMYKGKK